MTLSSFREVPVKQRLLDELNEAVTQMVHYPREQVVPQRFEDLRQIMVQVARAALSCHQPQQAVRSTGIIRTVV
ncbi:hypothetical protein KIN20_023038 [Parelaphostrongylus tenuis]|uniref:Uncharacterized protein n=1 Tax=Parelaphostrongylus tenuis TaxID=148309 RepID=A0AAD5QVM7_PARTN|nr:hypothetical protein KIN20_023038 [Parelaphostrongylus tenuis]